MFKNTLKTALIGGSLLASGLASALNFNEAFEGQWIESGAENAGNGQAFAFEYIKSGPEQGIMFLSGYVYDDAGEQFWLFGQTPVLDGNFSFDFDIQVIQGGQFVANPTASGLDITKFGDASLVVDTCRGMNLSINNIASDRVAATSVDVSLVPFDEIGGQLRDASVCPYQEAFTACPSFATAGPIERSCSVSGTLTGDITLTNNATWVLSGGVFVGGDNTTPANMTVEPGTRIVGASGNDFIAIQRGSKIFAEGTPNAPIVFSGPFNAGAAEAGPGNWGGLVINGNAPINVCNDDDFANCSAVGEGGAGSYGGGDANDSSGVLKYVRVQFGGFKINDTNELNGIAFQGVGAGTVVDYIQVHANEDDGIEFFGGTVNAKHVVLTDIRDDSLDWTQGWNGNVQYVLIQQNPDTAVDKDRGFESDNFDDGNDNNPRSQPLIANATLIGAAADGRDTIGMILKEGTGGNITNSIVTGFESCLDIDDSTTFAAAGAPDNLTGVLTINNTIFDCPVNFQEDGDGTFTVEAFFNAQMGNVTQTVNLENGFIPADNTVRGFTIDATRFGAFFDKVDYAGAFDSQSAAWTNGWTDFLVTD
ncbi:hypothetical protein [Marinicella sp. W31]|uniref:hypothetical protein n=1 Tax=Marinicella sp. W31 TaxID=3023713 RepID=UPI003756756B